MLVYQEMGIYIKEVAMYFCVHASPGLISWHLKDRVYIIYSNKEKEKLTTKRTMNKPKQ